MHPEAQHTNMERAGITPMARAVVAIHPHTPTHQPSHHEHTATRTPTPCPSNHSSPRGTYQTTWRTLNRCCPRMCLDHWKCGGLGYHLVWERREGRRRWKGV